MFRRLTYLVWAALLCICFVSCKTKQVPYDALHSDKRPSELAKEEGKHVKRHNRAYKREKKRLKKEIDKRSKLRLKGQYYDK